MIDYLRFLENNSTASRIHVICDNGRANKNKVLEEYLKTSKIKIHYLPPYSPNLNPIERLWKLIRERKTYNNAMRLFWNFQLLFVLSFLKKYPKLEEF